MHILDLVELDNIAEKLDKKQLDEIGARVVEEYLIDQKSMSDWNDQNDMARKLVDTKPEKKSDPWPGAANTKLPLILNAAMKVSAEELAEVMRGKDMVAYEMYGKETKDKKLRAERVSKRMNFQYHRELKNWKQNHDRLIQSKNLFGVVHKKLFFSPEKGKIECVLRLSGVVINDNVTNMDEAPRITDEIEKFWWQVEEKVRANEWLEIELTSGNDNDFAQADKVNEFLEQVRREDLDDDGYPEPYVVTVHRQTKTVVRIAPNYTPESIRFETKDGDGQIDPAYVNTLDKKERKIALGALKVVRVDDDRSRVRYIKYEMIPSIDGGYWSMGFGILLGALNDNCNEIVNQIINAGKMEIAPPIFVSQSLRMAHGEITYAPGQVNPINAPGGDISRAFTTLPVSGPSETSFHVLGLLMDVLRELSSVTEVVSGNQPEANMPAASIAMLIEQGKKSFGSIYTRHFWALISEHGALFDLNFLYEDPKRYLAFHDLDDPTGEKKKEGIPFVRPEDGKALIQGDFEREGMDVVPTANPKFSTKLQRIGEARTLKQELAESPNANQAMLDRMLVEAVLDDTERAAEIVPDQPNLTPQQAAEEKESAIQEFRDSSEARKLEAQAKKAEIDLERAVLEAEAAGVKFPMEVQRQESLTRTAGHKEAEAEHKELTAVANADKAVTEARQAEEEPVNATE